MPPNRRTQCATSSGGDRQRDQHGDRPLPRSRRGEHRHRRDGDDPATPRPTPAGCPRPARPVSFPRRRAPTAGRPATAATRPAATADDDRERGSPSENARPCTTRHHHRGDAERARPPVAHHRQRPLGRPVAAQPVGGVGQARRCAGRGWPAAARPPRARRPAGCPRRTRAPPPTARRGQRARARRPPPATRSARPGRTAAACGPAAPSPNANAAASERITAVADRIAR